MNECRSGIPQETEAMKNHEGVQENAKCKIWISTVWASGASLMGKDLIQKAPAPVMLLMHHELICALFCFERSKKCWLFVSLTSVSLLINPIALSYCSWFKMVLRNLVSPGSNGRGCIWKRWSDFVICGFACECSQISDIVSGSTVWINRALGIRSRRCNVSL